MIRIVVWKEVVKVTARIAATMSTLPISRRTKLILKAAAIIGLVIVFEKDCYGTVLK